MSTSRLFSRCFKALIYDFRILENKKVHGAWPLFVVYARSCTFTFPNDADTGRLHADGRGLLSSSLSCVVARLDGWCMLHATDVVSPCVLPRRRVRLLAVENVYDAKS